MLCTSATIFSTGCRLLGRGVSDAAVLSLRVRGLDGATLAVEAEAALVAGLRAGSPLSTRLLTTGTRAVFGFLAVV